MLRRWAIGEVYVELLSSQDKEYSLESLRLLKTSEQSSEEEGIERTLKKRHQALVSTLSPDTLWYTAKLNIEEEELNRIFLFMVPDLARISKGTYSIAVAAAIMKQNQSLNLRISGILKAFKEKKDSVQLSGITLIANDLNGPYTAIEGNGRLISIYQATFLEKTKIVSDQLEVVLGIYEDTT